MDDEAAVAGRNRGEVDLRRKPGGLAEHHVVVARILARIAGTTAEPCSNEKVVEAVAVDVAGRGYRIAGGVARVLAMDDEAAVAGGDGGEVDLRRKAAGVAEHHVAVASLDPCIVGTVALNSSDDEVVEAVAVDVTGR